MTATAIPRVRRALSGVEAAGAAEVARECMACAGADESEEVVRARLGARWGDIFPPKSLPPPKGEGYNFGQVGQTDTTEP
jgi:hypothetical protein